jgi:hypothetical protein
MGDFATVAVTSVNLGVVVWQEIRPPAAAGEKEEDEPAAAGVAAPDVGGASDVALPFCRSPYSPVATSLLVRSLSRSLAPLLRYRNQSAPAPPERLSTAASS